MAENVPRLGRIITGDAERDAVHVAVVPVEAAESFDPGEHIGINQEGKASGLRGIEFIGVVDPFLKHKVEEGEKFYLFLYPGTVISLRHHYRHPVLDAEEIRRETMEKLRHPSFLRLKEIAEEWGGTYQELMRATEWYLITDESMVFDGLGKGMNATTPPDFWEHYKRVTGKEVPDDKKKDFFTCSC